MIIHCDGSCYYKDRRMGVGIAFFETDSYLPFREEAITIAGEGSSNEAEYYAVIHALIIILNKFNTRQECITINSDSQLIINHITGVWLCKAKPLQLLLKEVFRLYSYIDIPRVLFNWVPRTDERQQIVDALSKQSNPYFTEKRPIGQAVRIGKCYKTKKK